jgi:hypothetical protein
MKAPWFVYNDDYDPAFGRERVRRRHRQSPWIAAHRDGLFPGGAFRTWREAFDYESKNAR